VSRASRMETILMVIIVSFVVTIPQILSLWNVGTVAFAFNVESQCVLILMKRMLKRFNGKWRETAEGIGVYNLKTQHAIYVGHISLKYTNFKLLNNLINIIKKTYGSSK
jgi:hypothetical protein